MITRPLPLLVLVAAALLAGCGVRDKVREVVDRRDDAEIMVAASGQARLEVERAIAHWRGAGPSMPASFWEDLRGDLSERDAESAIAAVYRQRLPAEDLQAAILFYQTETGKRLGQELPMAVDELVHRAVGAQDRLDKTMRKPFTGDDRTAVRRFAASTSGKRLAEAHGELARETAAALAPVRRGWDERALKRLRSAGIPDDELAGLTAASAPTR